MTSLCCLRRAAHLRGVLLLSLSKLGKKFNTTSSSLVPNLTSLAQEVSTRRLLASGRRLECDIASISLHRESILGSNILWKLSYSQSETNPGWYRRADQCEFFLLQPFLFYTTCF